RRYGSRERVAGPYRSIEAAPLEPATPRATATRPITASGPGERIFALSSFPPRLRGDELRNAEQCLRSWRAAGLEVRSFNHPTEIEPLTKVLPDLEIVPVPDTTERIF